LRGPQRERVTQSEGSGTRLPASRAQVDVPWKYLNFFLEDDQRLAEIGREYGAGRMLTGTGLGCCQAFEACGRETEAQLLHWCCTSTSSCLPFPCPCSVPWYVGVNHHHGGLLLCR
jgi:hypothetical protein